MPPKRNNSSNDKSNMSLDDVRYRVHKVSTLGWEGDDYAQELLNRAVKYGNIILARHKWRAIHVMEFFPRGENLLGLNVNMGEEIKVRLRKSKPKAPPKPKRAPARGKRGRNANTAAITTSIGSSRVMTMDTCPRMSFYSFEEILCTLIHEIVHCTISPHNAAFWKLYHELVAEVEQIQMEEYRNSPAGGGNVGGFGFASASPTSTTATTPFGGDGQKLGGGRASYGRSILFQQPPAAGGSSTTSAGGRLLGGASANTSPLTYEQRRAQIAAVLTQKYGAMQSPLSESDLLDLDNPRLNPFALAVDAGAASPPGRLTQVASERQNRGCGLTQPCPGTAAQPSSAFDTADPSSPLDIKREPNSDDARVPASTKSTATASEENWLCAECGFSNHILLPYCEMCCGSDDNDDPAALVEVEEEDEDGDHSDGAVASSEHSVEEIPPAASSSKPNGVHRQVDPVEQDDDGVIILE